MGAHMRAGVDQLGVPPTTKQQLNDIMGCLWIRPGCCPASVPALLPLTNARCLLSDPTRSCCSMPSSPGSPSGCTAILSEQAAAHTCDV